MSRRWLMVGGAVVLLDVSLTFDNVWPTLAVRWFGQLSIELVVCLLAIALATTLRKSSVPSGVIGALSAVWCVLVLGRYADVTAPALYGRDVNLYWDLRFIPDVAAMITRVAPVWLIAVSVVTAALVLAALFGIVWWAWRQIGLAMAVREQRLALTCVALLMLALFAWEKK
jgi:hypothetical protein